MHRTLPILLLTALALAGCSLLFDNPTIGGGPAVDDAGDQDGSEGFVPCSEDDDCSAGQTCCDAVCVGGDSGACCADRDCTMPPNACHAGDGLCREGECLYLPRDGSCDDGNSCTIEDTCINGECTSTPVTCRGALPPTCDVEDENLVVWARTCDPASGQCEDRQVATELCPACGESCLGPCADLDCSTRGDDCNTGLCSVVTGTATCVREPAPDGSPCGNGGFCQAGTCAECATNAHCNDENPCTTDSCVGGTCQHTASNGPCGSGGWCFQQQCAQCNSASQCPDDGNPCTQTACTNGRCAQQPLGSGACNVGSPCLAGSCVAGQCQTSPIREGQACANGAVDGFCQTGICAPGSCSASLPCSTVACTTAACVAGHCTYATDTAAACTLPNNTPGHCDTLGRCQACTRDDDCADAPCQQAACTNNQCTLTPTEGAACPSGVCNAAGVCVACLTPADCDNAPPCHTATCSSGRCAFVNDCPLGVCTNQGQCVQCETDVQCPDGVCVNQTCVECRNDVGCTPSNSCAVAACDPTTHTCVYGSVYGGADLPTDLNERIDCDPPMDEGDLCCPDPVRMDPTCHPKPRECWTCGRNGSCLDLAATSGQWTWDNGPGSLCIPGKASIKILCGYIEANFALCPLDAACGWGMLDEHVIADSGTHHRMCRALPACCTNGDCTVSANKRPCCDPQ